jgi:hypothetical protein
MILTSPRRTAARVVGYTLLFGGLLAVVAPAGATTAGSSAPATEDSPYAAPKDETGGASRRTASQRP